jgi:tetratricopeptide (TPR) repeat protein
MPPSTKGEGPLIDQRTSKPARRMLGGAAWTLAVVALPFAALADAPAAKDVKSAKSARDTPGAAAKGAGRKAAQETGPRDAGTKGADAKGESKPEPAAAARPAAPSAGAPAAQRWTAATPDEMVDRVLARGKQGGDDALAALVLASYLDDRASFGKVRDGLAAIAASSSPLADEARWLRLRLLAEPTPPLWTSVAAVPLDVAPDPGGLVKSFAIIGPFQDTAGGLMRREGPEEPGQSWSDMRARFDWGVYEVAFRRTLPSSATARGVPLDLYIHPRAESCSYLASRVTVPKDPRPMLVHVAATGAVRLLWDGADVAASEEAHARLVLDRITARLEPTAGDHLIALKVCTGSVNDDGRVRVRFTDERRAPLPLATSSDLTTLKIAPAKLSAAAPRAISVPRAPTPPSLSPSPSPSPLTAPEPLPARASLDGPKPSTANAPRPPASPAGKSAPVALAPRPTPVPAPSPLAGGAPGSAAASSPASVAGSAPGIAAVTNPPAPPRPRGEAAGGPARSAPLVLTASEDSPHFVPITPPPSVTVVRTSLDRGLDLRGAPSAERVLAASILRTLGGVDDARSPRAPGLLDRIASAPGTSADMLAMAGWLSPFGSNRSGWLNLALDRARAERDAAAVAFAQRRIAAAHLASRYVDWAFASIHEEPLRSAKDPEARLLRAMSERKLGSIGASRAALDEMLAIEAGLKAQTPISVLTEILDVARGQREIALRVARRLAEVDPDSRGPAYVNAARDSGPKAFETAAAESLGQQTSADDLIAIARSLLDAGRYAWAREAYYLATQLSPNRAAGFQGLAAARKAQSAIETRAGKPPEEDPELALMNLVRARDLEPGDAAIKAELALRSDEGSPASPSRHAMRDEQYIIPPEVFLARGKQIPVKKGTIADRELTWVRVVTYHPDKRVSQLMHYTREIVIEPRTENDLYENVPSEGDDTELLVARVHRKGGAVVMPEEQSSGGRRTYIRWPELKAGDVVEVAVRSWTAGPVGRRGDAPFYFIDYVGSTDTHPVLYNEVVVDSPQGSPLAIDVLNGKPDRVVPSQNDGRVVTRYIWDTPPTVPDEPLAPKLTETLPVVVGSTFAGWGAFREWYQGAVQGFTEPDDQVRRLAEELTRGKKTREDKLRAIFEFVADDIRYVNFVSSEWWLPNRPQELLARRQGDCDDKAMLLITLLKAIGIDATEVLVQTRYTGEPSLLRSEKAAIPVFDHGIAYLPGKNGAPGTWLDATSPESRLGPLPAMDARTVALFASEGPPKIVETPASSPDDHGIDADWTIKLAESGAGELTASERHTGDAAFELRMNLKQADARSQWVEQYLASGWFSTVQLKGDIEFKPDLPKGVAMLRFDAHSEGFARREGDELAVPIGEISPLTAQLAPLVKRTLPVVLPPQLAPGHEARTITIVAPPGYTFEDLPPGGDEPGGEFGRAHLEFARVKGVANAVVVKRSVIFDLSTIPVDKYAKWRAWLQRIDGLMHRMVRLAKVKSGSKGDRGNTQEAPPQRATVGASGGGKALHTSHPH